MGIVASDLFLALAARREADSIKRVLTIGRQNLYLHNHELQKLSNMAIDSRALQQYRWGDYAEDVIKGLFGADIVESLDASAFEGATYQHDLNQPLTGMDESFDLVIDGGTLEHVFNFPIAIANLMRLARTGGFVLTANPANNLCGHGFYQFTPELMHRVFSDENGFEVKEMVLTEHRFASVEEGEPLRAVQVTDPDDVGGRALIVGARPLMLRMLARKKTAFAGFLRAPQQSDYVKRWDQSGETGRQQNSASILRQIYGKITPRFIRNVVTQTRAGYDLSNKKFFKPWRP